MKLKEIYFVFHLLYVSIYPEESILCPEDFCDKVKCAALPTKCQIQNATHNGIFLPSPTTCNCCPFCMENIREGEPCSTGNPSNPAPTSICGPGLYCKLSAGSDFDGTCIKMNTTCTQKQVDYDERRSSGTIGSMEVRQTCDSEGLFTSYKCIPGQTCYCVDEEGNRIFGDSDFTSFPEANMQCKCSRDYVEAAKIMGKGLDPHEHFRCTSNGNYDVLQCFQDKCLCVNSEDGTPSYPHSDLVNLTLISKDTLPCYKEKTKGMYYKKCEKEYFEILKKVQKLEKQGFNMVLSFVFPKCDLDGTYQAVQENSTHKMCVDKEGNIITAVTLGNAESMDCKCLRALSVMSSDERPTCDISTGNYLQKQCRRGVCRCVDSDGNQVCQQTECEVPEYKINKLKC